MFFGLLIAETERMRAMLFQWGSISSRTIIAAIFQLRLEMADKKIESSGKADESRVQRLQARCDELQNELKKSRAYAFLLII